MSHFIEKCGYCGIVMQQCRCPSPDKQVRYSVCPKCDPMHEKAEMITAKTEEMLTTELQELARIIDAKMPENWGFGLVMFEYSTGPDDTSAKPLIWVSSASRENMVQAMTEFVRRNGGDLPKTT